MLRILAPLALLAALPAAAQNAAEQKMAATVNAETERHVVLLEKLVNQNSASVLGIAVAPLVVALLAARLRGVGGIVPSPLPTLSTCTVRSTGTPIRPSSRASFTTAAPPKLWP